MLKLTEKDKLICRFAEARIVFIGCLIIIGTIILGEIHRYLGYVPKKIDIPINTYIIIMSTLTIIIYWIYKRAKKKLNDTIE